MEKANRSLSELVVLSGVTHPHTWGEEVWLENNSHYCAKVIRLRKGHRSSWHYHERKDETFIILNGVVLLKTSDQSGKFVQVLELHPGQKYRIKPGEIHTFKSLTEAANILEVSKTDDDDNVKLEPAREDDTLHF
jgi:mannose-6-phosphate isomerase-like protein (cupin superfamily)